MAQLGVARAVVREALQGMAVMGLIETHDRRGSFVTLDLQDGTRAILHSARRSEDESIRELMEFRGFLECQIAHLAVSRRTIDELERLEQALRETEQAISSGQPILVSDLAFHRALATATHNCAFYQVHRSTSALFHSIWMQTAHVRERDEPHHADHTAIFRAVCDRDALEAARQTTEHIDDFARTLAQVLG